MLQGTKLQNGLEEVRPKLNNQAKESESVINNAIDKMNNDFEKLAGEALKQPKIDLVYDGKLRTGEDRTFCAQF